MPKNPEQGSAAGAPLVDAARLSKSYAVTFALLDAGVRTGTTFFPQKGMGFGQPLVPNPDTWVKDFSPDEVVVACWGRPDLLSASYVIDGKGQVTFGEPVAVIEKFVPLAGDEMTDALALTDAEVEVLSDGRDGAPRRLRLLSSKANTVINKRVYPMTLVRPAIAQLKPKAKTGMIFAETPHPAAIRDGAGKVVGFRSDPAKRVSRVVNVEVNDRGEVWTEHEFLDSALATSVYDSFVGRSGKYGISQRAIGELESVKLSSGQYPVAKSLEIHTYDFVENPALNETVSRFEVLLDDALGAIAPANPQPPTSTALEAASKKEFTTMGDENKTPGQAPVAELVARLAPLAPALTPEQAEMLQQAAAILNADKDAKAAAASRAAVKAAVTAEAPKFFAGIPEQFQARIIAKAEAAPTAQDAIAVLSMETDQISTMQAIAKANAMGMANPPAAQGVTTPTEGAPAVDIKILSNPTPHLEVARRMGEAHDAYMKKTENFIPDPVLRAHNAAFTDSLAASLEGKHGQNLIVSAEAILDSKDGWDVLTDSTTTANLWNQPTIVMMLLRLVYQDLNMMQWCGGIGPNGFSETTVNGQVGSILKVPTKIYVEPTGSLALPGYDSSLFTAGEDTGIAPSSIQTSWQNFFPQWRKVALIVTKEVQRAMSGGPLAFDVMAELSADMIADMKRRIDRALAEEMIATANEYASVNVATEATTVGNLINNGTTPTYGATVTFFAKLIGAGTAGAPGLPPVLRRRATADLNSSGQYSTAVKYAVGVTGGTAGTHIEGYLDAAGNINAIPGVVGIVTFAVDYENGIVVFNAASGVDATHLPTIAYNYATNYDVFHLTPVSVEPAIWYNRLVQQVDATAAAMGSFPKFSRPNLVLGSLVAMNYITNAQIFYEQASPKGTMLIPGTSDAVAERSGLNYARHNTPWSAGDASLLLTRVGATKLGTDTPLELEGPYPTYDASGNVKATKTVHATNSSVICTPQPVDQSGVTRNPVSRRILLRP